MAPTRRRPNGRPALDPQDPSTRVCLSLPSKSYDDLYTRARHARVTVPEFIRRTLARLPQRDPSTS